jgi:hypothetical protein
MIALVQAKARHARGYHHRVTLGGGDGPPSSLEAALDPEALDARGLLEALARSRYVVPGEPERSALVTRSVAFGGPMFAVFDDAELEVIRAWIRALPARDARSSSPAPPAPPARPIPPVTPAPVALTRAPHAPRLPLPELYHRLLCAWDPDGPGGAEARALARAHLERALPAVTPRALTRRDLWPYSRARLDAWVDARLDEEIERPSDGDPAALGIAGLLTREELLWLLTQLSPAALIDGAWLGGTISPRCLHTPPVAELLRIYRDELGAGVPVQHHGNVMRRALAAHGVELPPADSRALVERADLAPASFSLPVLWLAIAHDTPARLPELLGLNLAIEMAGLGRGYARAAALLRRRGIDPYFFELHNTIDNAASGHTAWSTRAIALYLDELGDPRAIDAAWLRVWQGHDAYARASAPLVRAIALRVGPRLAWRWLRRRIKPAKLGA